MRVRESVAREVRLLGWLSLLRLPTDRGAGDAAQRLLKCQGRCRRSEATDALTRLLEKCGCDRPVAVDLLNAEHPYN